jgi:hypothetical protein
VSSRRATTGAERRARAAFAVGGALLALALPRPAPDAMACQRPVERAAIAGRTGAVACVGPGPALRGPARTLFGLPIDPNAADALTLETLPGIGPVRAAAIVRERCRRRFRAVAELERVPGIGARTLARVAPALAVDGDRPARCGDVD